MGLKNDDVICDGQTCSPTYELYHILLEDGPENDELSWLRSPFKKLFAGPSGPNTVHCLELKILHSLM